MTDAAVKWLQANVVRLSSTDPEASLDELEPVRDIVGGARVVSLGEHSHFLHELYEINHRLTRFLVERMGFTAFALESSWPDGLRMGEWVRTGDGDLDELLSHSVSWRWGTSEEVRALFQWLRARNAAGKPVRYHGADISPWFGGPPPAVEGALAYLDRVDAAFAEALRPAITNLLAQFVAPEGPPIGYPLKPIPYTSLEPRPGSSEKVRHAPMADHHKALGLLLSKYVALDVATRNELTVLLQALVVRFEDRRVVYTSRSTPDEFEIGYRHALAARAYGNSLVAVASDSEFTPWLWNLIDREQFAEIEAREGREPVPAWGNSNVRDQTIADTVCWLLEREGPGGRIVLNMHNGHVEKCTWSPAVRPDATMAGGFLHERLGTDYRMIATSFNGGIVWGTPHHPGDDGTLDSVFARTEIPLFLLDFNAIPAEGPVADAFGSITTIRTDFEVYELDWRRAYDAVVFVDQVSPARFLG